MADFDGNMLRPIPVAATIPITPFGPITATTIQDGLEQMTNAINTANLLSATLFGAL